MVGGGLFQCSSASRKFLNRSHRCRGRSQPGAFSALQRAENSSIRRRKRRAVSARIFQCSSASRKFLNYAGDAARPYSYRLSVLFSEPKIPQSGSSISIHSNRIEPFSALQRAENSSMKTIWRGQIERIAFSALQRAENSSMFPVRR